MHYPEGTRYSNSEYPDVATGRRNEFGDTIFIQLDPKGNPTGRESVVIGGNLVGIEVAGRIHEQNTRDAAQALLGALKMALRHGREAMSAEDRAEFDAGRRGPEWMFVAAKALGEAMR